MKKVLIILALFFLSLTVLSCGKDDSESPDAHEHKVLEAWESDEVNHWHACSGCAELFDKAAHSFDNGVVTLEPTEIKEGVKRYTCICGYFYTEPIDKLEPTVHKHDVLESWESDEVNHWHACSGCDELFDKETHTFDDGVVTLEPTETKEGIKKYSCVCGYFYTESIDKLEPKEREIVVDYETQTIYVPSERDLRIAQFADLHIKLGYDGVTVDCSNDNLERTYAFIEQIISETDPDMIVCSGDNILTTGTKGLEEFIKLMESYQIPWVFVFGNHDAESNKEGYREVDLANFLKSYDTKYLIYADDYVEEFKTSYRDERYGNFVLEVCDLDTKELNGACFFFDAGVYDSATLGDYQRITIGQMDWYSNEIDKLQVKYKGDGVVPSIVFAHVQLPEYYYGYNDALNEKNNTKFVIYQNLSTVPWEATSIQSILNNSPKEDNGFFDLMVEKGSTKAYLAAHTHNLWFQIEKEGIILGFGPQTGFSKGFETNIEPRKSYVFNVSSSFEMTTTSVDEVEDLGSGLIAKYFDSSNGDYVIDNYTYDESTGVYTLRVLFKQYSSRVKLYFAGEELVDGKITMTGDLASSSATKVSPQLYKDYYQSTLIFSWEGSGTYVFTYNPATKTLNVKAPEKIETVDQSGLVYTGKYIDTEENIDVTGGGEKLNGLYYLSVNFSKEYGRIIFKYNGITLTPDNTIFKGLYLNAYDTDWTNKLYWSPTEPGQLISATGGSYLFVYNPITKTLSISSQANGVFSPQQINNDSSMTVWTEAGTEVKDLGGWVGNGWRVYIVVDKEGKITYGVLNPTNGYGGVQASSYFRHTDYADFTKNPAFSYISEPYEGKWGITYDFKVAVPEGGFIITAYDDYKTQLLEYILGVSDTSAANVNKNTNNVDNVRIQYDEATGMITITK